MKLPKIVTTILLLTSSYCYANSWLQAELTYNQTIDNKQYLAKVSLLRPESYFMENHATKREEKLTVNLPEMGLNNVAMNIVSIKPFKGMPITENGISSYKQLDEIVWIDKTNRPVTGTFKRYAKEVYSYKFRNLKTHEISIINATPNHPFYVINKHAYIPIAKVTADDKLLSQAGEALKLECPKSQQYNCGTIYNKDNNQPTRVYNFEVYQQHRYFIADESNKQGILVHNPCHDCKICRKIFNSKGDHTAHARVHTNERPHPCLVRGCTYRAKTPGNLTRHKRVHLEEKPYNCPVRGCVFDTKHPANIQRHTKSKHPELPNTMPNAPRVAIPLVEGGPQQSMANEYWRPSSLMRDDPSVAIPLVEGGAQPSTASKYWRPW